MNTFFSPEEEKKQLESARSGSYTEERSEAKLFRETLDVDGDGSLDLEEMAEWVRPVGFVQAKSEVVYLMQLLDSDQSMDLSPEEIFDEPEAFLSSQVTQYGQVYKRLIAGRKIFQFPTTS